MSKALIEGEIRIYNDRGRKRRFIKHNGKRILYSHYIYEKNYHPLRPEIIVHHKDDNTLNDNPKNLKAITRSQHNTIHNIGNSFNLGIAHTREAKEKISLKNKGKQAGRNNPMYGRKGEKSPNYKLSQKEVNQIRYFSYIKKLTQQKIANRFKVSQGCICQIVHGHSWNSNNLTKEKLIKLFKQKVNARKY